MENNFLPTTGVLSSNISDQTPLTADLLRKFRGFDHLSEEEADSIVASIKILAEICLFLEDSGDSDTVAYTSLPIAA